MADEPYSQSSLTLHARHVPEDVTDARAQGYDVDEPTTGDFQIGVEIEGVFVPIFSEKAAKIFRIIEVGKEQQAASESSSE